MRLPIGIQDFATLREANMVYVDKTQILAPLLETGRYFFARPRRFGKSLLLSTLKAVFEGRKELFKGLWLEHKHDFQIRPVIRLDFSRLDYQVQSLEVALLHSFRLSAKEYNLELHSESAKSAFEELILELSKIKKVVVLIDEYDQPITDTLFEPEKRYIHQETLKSVFGILKPLDEYLHLVWITGVSKIGKLSLFSSLNNIQDISMNPKYATLCGYSKAEIEQCFPTYLENAAANFSVSVPEIWDAIQFWYNGYSWDAVHKVYCPFSFLLFLELPEFKSYWYETGTPTWLIAMIKNQQFNPLEFEKIAVDAAPLVSTDVDSLEPVGLMFQTGYLTIQKRISQMWGTEYELGYPNQEVRVAFSRGLLEQYAKQTSRVVSGFAVEFRGYLFKLNWDALFARANQVLAGIPYEIFPRQEVYFNSLWHLMLTSTGLRTQSQVQTSLGRMDTLLETTTHFIIFELKIGGQSENAVQQISSNQYAQGLSGKPVLGVGLVFDLAKKAIVSWEVKTMGEN
jgi:hypothetical protein